MSNMIHEYQLADHWSSYCVYKAVVVGGVMFAGLNFHNSSLLQ
jgi:hypothetical protein